MKRFLGLITLPVFALLTFLAAPAGAQTIKIGVIIPGSGPFAIIGEEVKNGLEMYFAEQGNTVAGRKVELIIEDDGNKPEVGLAKAKKLIERDGVSVITGIVSSSVAYALRDYIAAAKIPIRTPRRTFFAPAHRAASKAMCWVSGCTRKRAIAA